jgi:hypothetical protein
MPSTWQETLRQIATTLQQVTTPARDLWHARILSASGLAGEEAAWRRIAEHEALARKPLVATDRSVPKRPLGRYFGDRTGLDLFRSQADAALRCLIKGERVRFNNPEEIPTRDCSPCWLDIVYNLASRSDSGPSLMARERVIQSCGEWVRRRATGMYEVGFAVLERDVFSSSVAAIDVLLRSPPAEATRMAANVERMREAIRTHPQGRKAKATPLCRHAGIADKEGREALRYLEERGEYDGFPRKKPRRYTSS